MRFISTKDLRATLPSVRRQLAKGEEYLLIHQSKPIATISPIHTDSTSDQQTVLEDFQQATIEDVWNDDFLSKEEVDYYLSLP